MGEDGNVPPRGGWKRRARIALAIFAVLVLIFHRPLLQGLVRQIALHFGAEENLKMDFQLEGNVFTGLTVRNFHAVATGPSDVESIDAEFAHGDYSLWQFLRHGPTAAFRNIELRNARFVLNPAGTALRVRPPRPDRKITLPGIIPLKRLRMTNVDLIVRNQPHDFVAQHVDLDLNPHTPGELRIGKLQLPTAPPWLNLSAPVSYAKSNLVVRDLVLNQEERIRTLTVDTSRVRSGMMTITLEMEMGAGKLSASLAMQETRTSLNTESHLIAQNVTMEGLDKYLGLPEEAARGDFVRLAIDMTGVLNRPRTWSGTAAAQINNYRGQWINFASGDIRLAAKNGKATIEAADFSQDQNEFHFRGWADLPGDIKQVGRADLSLEVTGSVLNLQPFTAGGGQPLTGSAQINGRVDIKEGKLETSLNASGEGIGFKSGKIDKLSANVKAAKTMPTLNAPQPWFTDLRSEIVLNGSDIVFREYVFDSVEGSVNGMGDLLTLDRLVVRRKQNELSLRGRHRLPQDLSKLSPYPERMEIALNAPELGDYWIAESRDKISGPLQINGQVEWKEGIADGKLAISGTNMRMRDLVFKDVGAQCSIVHNIMYLNDLAANLNERDFVKGNAIVDLDAPHAYRAKLTADIADLSKLQPLLSASGNENELAGSLVMDWEFNGDMKIYRSGTLKLVLDKGRYGELKGLHADMDASYSPDGLDVPIIFVRTESMYFQASAQAKDETLEISQIQLDQQQAKYASGYVSIPFIWKNLGTDQTVCPPNGNVVATVQSENIDIKKLFEDIGLEPMASGVLNVKLDAKGTIADLDARLDVQIRELRSETVKSLEPATFDLTALAQHDQLSIQGKLQQSRIQPLELTANLPFDIPKIARQRKIPDDTPITAKLQLPRSSVNFIRQFIPDIDTLDGDLALDVDAKGTFGDPILSGTGDITINLGRFHNATLPTLRDFKARITFARNAFTLEQFGGELAGGRFTMGGRVTFPKLTQAELDLQFKADTVLVARNDDLTARADADLKITGPFLSATVTGSAALTNSQFLKNIDLIPIGLPGRPAPQPLADRPEISFPDPPLRDWKFDIALKTKDPFLIRGNLANGGAIADMHVTGTGGRLILDGTVRLENVEATLPFSRLQVSYGILYFDPNDSFNPRIELQGTSIIRDYIIHVYVYGTSLAPEAIFSSEPPLPQEEIISLLATGTTREQLTGSNSVLASRASMLLVQQLYRKIFKKGQGSQTNSVFDRLDVDFGTVDPRTGQQQATARLRINDQFSVIGDLGVGGDYRGMVKYVIRFR